MAKAWLLSLSKAMSLRAGYALVSDANAAKNMNVNTITSNGAGKIIVRHGVVSARNAKEHVVGDTVNAEGFEVLSAFKSNCGMGRSMPKLVEGGALRVATMWARRVGKRVEEG